MSLSFCHIAYRSIRGVDASQVDLLKNTLIENDANLLRDNYFNGDKNIFTFHLFRTYVNIFFEMHFLTK